MTSNFLPPVRGKVIERINRKEFLIRCDDNNKIIKAYVVARFRTKEGRRKANIAVGDKVVVEIILRDQEKGEIISLV
jgi:translation initiation factor IF-1